MVWHDMACLIVIYDCVGTYKETIILVGMLVNDDINLHFKFVVMSVSVPLQENHYIIILTIYIRLGDAAVCFI